MQHTLIQNLFITNTRSMRRVTTLPKQWSLQKQWQISLVLIAFWYTEISFWQIHILRPEVHRTDFFTFLLKLHNLLELLHCLNEPFNLRRSNHLIWHTHPKMYTYCYIFRYSVHANLDIWANENNAVDDMQNSRVATKRIF